MVDENTVEVPSDGGEFLGEDEFEGSYAEEVVVAQEVNPRRGTSWFLVLSGIGFLMAGVALVFAPDIDPRLADIGQALASVGMLPSAFLVSGIVLVGLGFVARAVGDSGTPSMPETSATDHSDFMLVADQLATDIAQARTSMLQICESVAGLEEGQRMLMEGLKTENQPSDAGHNSLFRLAASMDQLNAHIDEGLEKLESKLNTRFSSLAGSVQKAVDSIALGLEAAKDCAPAPQAIVTTPEVPAVQPEPAAAPPSATPAPQPAAPLAEPAEPVNEVEQLGSALEEQLAMAAHPMDMADLGASDPPAPLPEPPPAAEASLDFFDEMEQPALETGIPQAGTEASASDLDSLLPDESIRRALGE